MFRKKKQETAVAYDRTSMKPVLKCSICTGEQVAGLKNLRTGQFEEVMLIRSAADLERFKAMYRVDEVEKIY